MTGVSPMAPRTPPVRLGGSRLKRRSNDHYHHHDDRSPHPRSRPAPRTRLVRAAGHPGRRHAVGAAVCRRSAGRLRHPVLLLVPVRLGPGRRPAHGGGVPPDRFRGRTMIDWIALSVFIGLVAVVTVLGFLAARWRRGDLNQLQEWGLAGRRFGTVVSWF